MQFKLSTAGTYYPDVEQRRKLGGLGFTFIPCDHYGFSIFGNPIIDIPNLEGLMELVNNFDDIIVSEGEIKIYDNCNE